MTLYTPDESAGCAVMPATADSVMTHAEDWREVRSKMKSAVQAVSPIPYAKQCDRLE